jgi:hypothetical protein
MKLRDAKAMLGLHLLLAAVAVVVFPPAIQAQVSSLSLTDFNSTAATASSCPLTYVSSCISVAIIEICGNINETSCVCGPSGQGQIATKAAPCLLVSCPYNFLISLAGNAGSACEIWISTHTLTGSALMSAESAINASRSAAASPSSAPASPTNSGLNITALSTLTAATASDTSTTTPATTSAGGLPLGAGIGVGVGAFAILSGAIAGIILCRRHKKRAAHAQRPSSPAPAPADDPNELQTESNIHELADKQQRLSAIGIPPQELEGFQFPFQQGASQGEAVEADSRSVRAGHPRGRMAGTETTAFDFETQKVLLTPAFVRTPGSRAASVSTTESGGRRVPRPGTAGASSTRSGTADKVVPGP